MVKASLVPMDHGHPNLNPITYLVECGILKMFRESIYMKALKMNKLALLCMCFVFSATSGIQNIILPIHFTQKSSCDLYIICIWKIVSYRYCH